MLTIEQKAALHRLEGQEGVLSALFNEVKEKIANDMINSERHESKKREDLHMLISLIPTMEAILKTSIQSYKNSL